MALFNSFKKSPSSELLCFLESISYFQSLPKRRFIALARQFTSVSIQSGDVLLREGDLGNSLYIVHTGRLLALKSGGDSDCILGEMVKGDMIGELALFTQQPRAATVLAIRDSVLWQLTKEQFDLFFQKNAAYIMPMVSAAILRLLKPPVPRTSALRALALMPAGHSPLDEQLISALIPHLAAFGSVLLITHTLLKQHFNALDLASNQYKDSRITQWLNVQEQHYAYIFYVVDSADSAWSRLCLRQADKIILIAQSEDNVDLAPLEHELFAKKESRYQPAVELFLFHPAHIIIPSNTTRWLNERAVKAFHIKKESDNELKRMARLILNSGTGLVLSGGGARSLAHIGVYKALCELNIPIDYIGGTSMGAVIAAAIAMNFSIEHIIELINKHVVFNKKLNDYTLPNISLLGGEGWLNAYKNVFSEQTCIEDLWKSFFCIASNFTMHKVEVLDKGLLYKAIRASTSLPGIVPPISNANNELLIDGGIFNNLPVDVMRDFARPKKLIAVRVAPFSSIHAQIPDGIASGFKRYFPFLNRGADPILPNISEIITGSIVLCSNEYERYQLTKADNVLDIDVSTFGLLDFSKLPQLVELGYQAAMEQYSNQLVWNT